MWHKDKFCYETHVVGIGFIAVVGQHINSGHRCFVVNVYAACNFRAKVTLWEDLSLFRGSYQNMVGCFCEDFNAVRREDERKGIRRGSCQRKEMGGFNGFIDTNCLVDIPTVGKKYTWFKPNGTAKSRLDRFLVSEEWIQIWPFYKQYVQQRTMSDHCAIVAKSWVKDWGPKPFCSIDAWFLEPGFKTYVQEKWGSYNTQGNNMSSFKEKLKFLKADLKVWNRNVFGCLQTSQRQILKEIENLDTKDDNEDLEEHDRLKRMELLSQLRLVDSKMDSLSRQKARANWCKFGDMNSKFYHTTIRWRRLKNEVKGVEVGGQWCEEPEVVRREAKSLFEKRFTATQDFGVNLGSVEFKCLPQEISKSMVTSFTEEEVKEAVWQCEGTKSPGLDGFNFTFTRNCWDYLKNDIMEALHLFHEIEVIPKGCNASFIGSTGIT